jgi:hypothetical protein
MTEVTRSCYYFSFMSHKFFFICSLFLYCLTFPVSHRNRKQQQVTHMIKGSRTGSRNSYTFCMYIRYRRNTIVLLLNKGNQVAWSRFFSHLK